MSLFLELWRLLGTRERRGFVVAQALALVMAAFNLAGVAAVVPFFAVLGEPQLTTRNPLHNGGAIVTAGTYAQLTRQSERFERLLHGGDAAAARLIRERASAGPGARVHKE